MANPYDFTRFTTFVNGLIDKKVRGIAQSVSTSTTFLKSLKDQAFEQAGISTTKAGEAANSAATALTNKNLTVNIQHDFAATYLGRLDSDPSVSVYGDAVKNGAFYIRNSDKRLRSVSVDGAVVTWTDASVKADRQSIIDEGNTLFLSLSKTTEQVVTGPVKYTGAIHLTASVTFDVGPTVPSITDWTSHAAVPAVDVRAIQTNLESSFSDLQTAFNTFTTNTNTAISNFEATFESGVTNGIWWCKRPGIVEMFGRYDAAASTGTFTVNLPFPLSTTDYVVTATASVNGASNSSVIVQINRASLATNSFQVVYQRTDSQTASIVGFAWHLIQYAGNS